MKWLEAGIVFALGLALLAAGIVLFVIREGERITITTPPESPARIIEEFPAHARAERLVPR